MSTAREKVVEWLKRRSAFSDTIAITDSTEIYYDLRVFGDDMDEFLVWLEGEFQVKVYAKTMDYCPPEGMPPIFFRKWRWCRERKQRCFKSITVADIFSAIEAGYFPVAEKS